MIHRSRELSVLVRVGLFAAALIILRHQLQGTSVHDLRASLATFGWSHAAISIALTAASFATMAAFEKLALEYLENEKARRISLLYAASTSFVANAFSQSAGVAILTGTAVRLRAYPSRGLSKSDVVRISTFTTLTATLGLLIVASIALLGRAETVPFGIVLALPVIAYTIWFLSRPGRVYGRGRFSFQAPTRTVGLLQLGLSSLDWILAASVLFFLLPASSSIPYLAFLPLFFIAQTAATASHVPGGAGVFEAILLSLLATSVSDKTAIVASLLAYRLFYYALPLLLGIGIAAAHELWRRPVFAQPAL